MSEQERLQQELLSTSALLRYRILQLACAEPKNRLAIHGWICELATRLTNISATLTLGLSSTQGDLFTSPKSPDDHSTKTDQ